MRQRVTESTFVTHYRNDVRSIRNISRAASSPNEYFESKITQKGTSSLNGLYRFNTSREVPLSRTQVIESLGITRDGVIQGAIGQTYRLRYIYNGWQSGVLLNNQDEAIVDVHITFRTESKYGSLDQQGKYPIVGTTRQSVSIEIETSEEYPENTMNALVQRILTMHNGWDVPNLAQVIPAMKTVLTGIGIRSVEDLQTPLDMTWNDLTYDRLILKPHTISFKADGTRMLLVTSPVGTFFATSTLNIIPLSVPIQDRSITSTTHVLDGELMSVDSQDVHSIYWVFDLLYSDGNNYMGSGQNIRHAPIPLILQDIGNIGVPNGDGVVQLRLKPTVTPTTAEEFFNGVEYMIRYTEDNNIRSDGLIFTGVNQVYRNNVLKWKPPTLLSVDFFIGPPTSGTNNVVTLGTFLRGDINYHSEFIPLPSDGTLSDLIGTVGEFEYVRPSKPTDPVQWRYMRPRNDKGKPNGENVLNSILRLQKDPITQDAITGRSLHLMRKYHNRVKRAVYDLLRASDIGTITDIGSGKGGDISSWERNSLDVIAVEPDPNNINDVEHGFLTRVRNMGATIERGLFNDIPMYIIQGSCWSTTLLPMDAQQYIQDALPSLEKTDGLTLFNSATFLGPSTLCTLVNESVKDTGTIVIMVMDGNVLRNTFLQNRSYNSSLIDMEYIPCEGTQRSTLGTQSRGIGVRDDQFGDLGCISIRLKDSSTVGETQVEGLVDVSVLLDALRTNGWVSDIDMFLTQEPLMGSEESMYSSAQRLLILRRASTSTHVIRNVYRPLNPGTTSTMQDSPWGNIVRVGVLSGAITEDMSFTHAILQATDQSYRSMDNISKTMYATGKGPTLMLNIGVPLYIIPSINWNMYIRTFDEDNVLDMYPAIGGTQMNRTPGIVLMDNQGHWEPLAKRTIGDELQYIW